MLGTALTMQVNWGAGSKTYISPAPNGAATHSAGKTVPPEGATSTWYISKDGETWEEYIVKARYAEMNVGVGVIYVYIPMSEFWTRDGVTILGGGTQETATEEAVDYNTFLAIIGEAYKFSNVRFDWSSSLKGDTGVKLLDFNVVTTGIPQPPVDPIPDEHETLNINDKYTISFNRETDVDKEGNFAFNYWQGADMGIAKLKDSWIDANGFMFKFDTSNVSPENKEMMGLAIQFSIGNMPQYTNQNVPGSPTGANSGLYFVTAGMVRYHGGEKTTYNGQSTMTNGVTSTWYYTTDDGATWKTVVEDSSKSRCAVFTNEHTTGYIYLPFDSLWCMGVNAKGLLGYNEIGTFADGVAAMRKSGNLDLNNFGLCLNSANVGKEQNLAIQPETVFSEFCFVKFDSLAIETGSITVSDSISWNVYANVPYKYVGASMTFTIGERTETVEGVREPNGKMKFVLSNIAPEQIGQDITMKLTVTDEEGTVTEKTASKSILAYCKSLMQQDAYEGWFEAMKAFLHYAEAVRVSGQSEGTSFTEGVANVTEPVDMSTLTGSFTNNAGEGVWSVVALVVADGKLTLAVEVGNGATAVRYTVAGFRSEVVSVEDGVALIPVSFHNMQKEITLECYDAANNAATADGTLVLTADYVLLAAYAAETDATAQAALQAVANLGKEAAAMK